MMVTAYIIVKVEPGKEGDVTQELVKINGITEGTLTWGFSDVLLKVNVESDEKLKDIVFKIIRKIPGITDTETIIVSETFFPMFKTS